MKAGQIEARSVFTHGISSTKCIILCLAPKCCRTHFSLAFHYSRFRLWTLFYSVLGFGRREDGQRACLHDLPQHLMRHGLLQQGDGCIDARRADRAPRGDALPYSAPEAGRLVAQPASLKADKSRRSVSCTAFDDLVLSRAGCEFLGVGGARAGVVLSFSVVVCLSNCDDD